MIEMISAPYVMYAVRCIDKHGKLKWEELIRNLVTTAGKTDLIEKYLEGSGYTAAWYLSLIDNASYTAVAVGDTMASHAGWIENVDYDESTREAISWGAAAAGVKAADVVTEFTMNASKTIKGCFMTTGSAKSGTTGVLYSAAAFGANRVVVDDDKIQITPTMTVT